MTEYLSIKNWDSGPPPAGLGPDDLAVLLLRQMGIGWSNQNAVAASDALRIKAAQPNFDIPKAWTFILKQWADYKASPSYRSEFRRKASTWLSEGDYDNPESWGGRPLPKAFAAKASANGGDSIADWKRDRELHPENYLTAEEAKDFVRQLKELAERKRMPDLATPAQLKQKDASNSSTVGSQHTLDVPKNNGLER